MLFEAAYWRTDAPRPSQEDGLARPDLVSLLADWGRTGDTGVVALHHATPIGAAWYRLWTSNNHSYGFVDSDVPEIGIGVVAAHRGQGVGRSLLRALIEEGRRQKYKALSLSVEKDNPAARLYESERFKVVNSVGNAWTMTLDLC